MHYDFARVKHNLERDLRGCTLTMDQARELAEIIVMCTDNPKRSHAKDCKCQACYQSPIMQHFMDEVNKCYSKVIEDRMMVADMTRLSQKLLPKPRGWEGD